MYKITNPETTILCPSNYNYNTDALEYINSKAEIVSIGNITNLNLISFDILNEFSCLYLLRKKNLTKLDEIKINILNALTSSKNTIVFFNVLTYFDQEFKLKVIKYLESKNKTIINYTTEIEETLLLDYLIIIHENKIIMEGLAKDILKEEKIIKKLGYNLPFIIELSSALKYYGLINKIYYDNKSLVDDLWN